MTKLYNKNSGNPDIRRVRFYNLHWTDASVIRVESFLPLTWWQAPCLATDCQSQSCWSIKSVQNSSHAKRRTRLAAFDVKFFDNSDTCNPEFVPGTEAMQVRWGERSSLLHAVDKLQLLKRCTKWNLICMHTSHFTNMQPIVHNDIVNNMTDSSTAARETSSNLETHMHVCNSVRHGALHSTAVVNPLMR